MPQWQLLVTLTSMSTSGGQLDNWNSVEAAEMRSEALDVVMDTQQWELTDARWEAIDQILMAMDAALAARDPKALGEATVELELQGPLRIIRIGSNQAVPANQRIRDQLADLVLKLGATSIDGNNSGSKDTGR